MSLTIKFDPDQAFQRDAIDAVLDLFEGQYVEAAATLSTDGGSSSEGRTLWEAPGIIRGNAITVSPQVVGEHLRAIQDRNGIAEVQRMPLVLGEMPRDFSIEMETGTGKTYVELRTIAELYVRRGLSKFVIVVPSVAIREGVLTAMEMLRPHFRELYDGLSIKPIVYSARAKSQLREFAQSNQLQVLIMNVDAFLKEESNVIYRYDDDLGRPPIEYLQACRPVVIMDEPQRLGSPKQTEAIGKLNPLVRLRYSATHKDLHHLLYRLTPVDAYDQHLVKGIDVWSVTQSDDKNSPYVLVKAVHATTAGVTATAVIQKMGAGGTISETQVTLRRNDDLLELSGDRSAYDGWIVEQIATDPERVEFQNSITLYPGEEFGPDVDALHRLQIRTAILEHLDKEVEFRRRAKAGEIAPIKVLSLFFIDKVAHYYPADGKFKQWFIEEYERALTNGKYKLLKMPPAAEVHKGYFAVSGKGDAAAPKDSRESSTAADNDAFELIMHAKERLLSPEEPVRFIFSHSALAEGWDNPNVFVICTLRETKQEMTKRQQIGRGLRLPVMTNGERCTLPEVNRLTVVANESFETFARDLQRELKEDAGVDFTERIKSVRARKSLEARKGFELDPNFEMLWSAIKRRTHYRVAFDTETLVREAVKRVKAMPPISPVSFVVTKGEMEMSALHGVEIAKTREKGAEAVATRHPIPDLLAELTRDITITRATAARILIESGRLHEVKVDPATFVDHVGACIRRALEEVISHGIEYTLREDEARDWDMTRFSATPTQAYSDNLVPVPEGKESKSLFTDVIVDSDVERAFALDLLAHDDVDFFLKLPAWFKIDTPVGGYNPDWALVFRRPEGDPSAPRRVVLVRETKGSASEADLWRENEVFKIRFGRAHFDALTVSYRQVKTLAEALSDFELADTPAGLKFESSRHLGDGAA